MSDFIALPEMVSLDTIPCAPASLKAKGVVRYGSVTLYNGKGHAKLICVYEKANGSGYARVQYSYAGRYSTQVDVFTDDDYITAFLLAAAS
jgi:hypothetical protein